MIVIEMFLVCNLNTTCPKINPAHYQKAEMFLERELQEEIEFKFKKEKITIKQDLIFNSRSLYNFNFFQRQVNGTVAKHTKTPMHIYGFVVNGDTQFYGQADVYGLNNAFYVKEGTAEKTISHEVLHLFGFAHNQDRNDIMKQGTPCPAKKNIMECTNTGENTFWEIDSKYHRKVDSDPASQTHNHHHHHHHHEH